MQLPAVLAIEVDAQLAGDQHHCAAGQLLGLLPLDRGDADAPRVPARQPRGGIPTPAVEVGQEQCR